MDREEAHFRRVNSLGESLRQKSVYRVRGMSKSVKNWCSGSPLSVESPERLASPVESTLPAGRWHVDGGRIRRRDPVRVLP